MQEQICAPAGAERLQQKVSFTPLKKETAKVLAFVNQKGGTGKTTIAQNLAVCFDLYHDKRVLCVDLDPQGNLGQGLIHNQIDTPKTADRLLVVPKASINEYIIKVRPNPSRSSFVACLGRQSQARQFHRVKKALVAASEKGEARDRIPCSVSSTGTCSRRCGFAIENPTAHRLRSWGTGRYTRLGRCI
jgi:hypothetical protein